jgi:hypothetical protein
VKNFFTEKNLQPASGDLDLLDVADKSLVQLVATQIDLQIKRLEDQSIGKKVADSHKGTITHNGQAELMNVNGEFRRQYRRS